MPLVALTGGIASGKSTIARRLAERGAVVVDADQIVREVQAPGSSVLARIAEEFGADVILADGSLDRAALGARVFGDPDAIARLNAIVHPAVRTESARRFAAAFAAEPSAVVVYDVPLLVEARADDPWDLIVVAHAPAEVRRSRLVELRGMTEDEASARIASQVSDDRRLAVADVVIDTAGTMDDTRRSVDELWDDLAGRISRAVDRSPESRPPPSERA
jgi:dephospho-CoA kinase